MKPLLFILYRFVFVPAAVLALPFAALGNAKIREGLRRRRKPIEPFPEGVHPLWIHASSGEFEYAKAVIRECKSRFPDVPIVVTYFSPTFARAVENFPGVDRALPLPLDLPGPCRSFLRLIHPRALLIARTDLWPEMLTQCRRANVPTLLFSYTQKHLASRFKRAFTRLMLGYVRHIYCVTGDDAANVRELDLPAPVEVLGDTRYDQVLFRLQNPKPLPPALKPDPLCLVAGSTWSEDEAVLLPALAEALRARRLRLILVPHEPTPKHLEQLTRELAKHGLTHALFSGGVPWLDKQVLLVDKIGVLAELYLWGDFAFVGGSFRKTVHSVMEALGAGCVTWVGPLHANNREALDFKALGLLRVAESADDLKRQVEDFLTDPARAERLEAQTRAEFARRLGGSRRFVNLLENYLGPSSK